MAAINLLIVDDDEDDYILTKETLEEIESLDVAITWVGVYDEAEEALISKIYDLAFIDYRLGKDNGIALIRTALQRNVLTPMIILTGKGDKHIDNQAMEEGAVDYLVKDEITPVIMERSIRYALKNAENLQKIIQSETKFKHLFERSLDAIFITDYEHYILDANCAMMKMLGYSYDELIGLNMVDLCLEGEEFDVFQKKLIDEYQIVDFELALHSKDENVIICQISSVARVDNDDKIVGYQGIIKDITLKKNAERELIVAERLSLTGKLARSIAHEIRNPLTNLSLAMEQLRDEVVKTDDTELFLGIIERNAKRIDLLISELMDSSKIQTLEKGFYNINSLLRETLVRVKDRIILRKLALIEDYEEDLPSTPIDVQQLKTAFLNILVNAVEAVDDFEGKLHITTKSHLNHVIIEIKDNGCGISSESLRNLFDPFFTQKKGGVGLGLTSTQTIIQNHQGRIDVSSELGVGTTFTIYLPLS